MRQPGFRLTRRQLREGSEPSVEWEHYDEVLGSSEFYVYVTPNRKTKGFEALKSYLIAQGCQVEFTTVTPVQMPERYQVVKVTYQVGVIPNPALRRVHKWAHGRNFLHSFFQPMRSSQKHPV